MISILCNWNVAQSNTRISAKTSGIREWKNVLYFRIKNFSNQIIFSSANLHSDVSVLAQESIFQLIFSQVWEKQTSQYTVTKNILLYTRNEWSLGINNFLWIKPNWILLWFVEAELKQKRQRWNWVYARKMCGLKGPTIVLGPTKWKCNLNALACLV